MTLRIGRIIREEVPEGVRLTVIYFIDGQLDHVAGPNINEDLVWEDLKNRSPKGVSVDEWKRALEAHLKQREDG